MLVLENVERFDRRGLPRHYGGKPVQIQPPILYADMVEWQTRKLEVLVSRDVQVQVLLSAPIKFIRDGYMTIFIAYLALVLVLSIIQSE